MNFIGDLTLDFSKLPLFSYSGCEFLAKVTRVIDGDTIEIVFYESGIPRKMHLRMNRYDSPESKPPLSDPDRLLCKEAALKCKERLEANILNRIVKVVVIESNDKYGRLLGEVFINFTGTGMCNVNDIMISMGCLTYTGGKKEKYTSSQLTTLCGK
jgi:endonuclease YncB( thermonuclease family)